MLHVGPLPFVAAALSVPLTKYVPGVVGHDPASVKLATPEGTWSWSAKLGGVELSLVASVTHGVVVFALAVTVQLGKPGAEQFVNDKLLSESFCMNGAPPGFQPTPTFDSSH